MSVVELTLLLLALLAVLTSFGKSTAKTRQSGSEADYCKMYDSLVYDPAAAELERELLSRVVDPEATVLEVGCRTGRVSGWLNAETVGVDESKEMVAVARTKYPDKTFMVGDVLKRTTFRPDTFTHVLCFRVYCCSEKLLLFQHCFYWLKAKGRLVVQVNDPANSDYNGTYKCRHKGKVVGNVYRERLECGGKRITRESPYYPEANLQKLVEMAGFALVESNGPFLVFVKKDF